MYYPVQSLSDTIVALATPPGIGAIGVIRLSGEDALRIAGEVFHGKDLDRQPTHTVHFGTIRDSGTIIDEVLATVFRAPKSYTGEDVVEISCHGSSYILQRVLQVLQRHGARLARPGEFTLRAFLNGRMDLSQAEAVADLIASGSASAHALAMRQMRGGISHEISHLREELIHFASLIELELDFGEEDVEFADRQDLLDLVQRIRAYVHRLMESFDLGNAIKNGVVTVIAGRPNAGKSTLLNALLNEERAIVSEIAGTTRDTIEEVLNIHGVQFRLIDTAGIREAQDQIEAIGVQKTMEKVQQAAVLIYVFDVMELSADEVTSDLRMLCREGLRTLVVCNKMDRNPHFELKKLAEQLRGALGIELIVISASAKNAMNIPYLKEELYRTVIHEEKPTESTVVTNARHLESLQKTEEALRNVVEGLQRGITGDFLAMDIRRALHHLGEITGRVDVEDLLENIFSRFCIGK